MANPTIAVRAEFDELRSLAFGSIGAAYVAIGTPFDFPVHVLYIQNLTDANLLFTDDQAPTASKVDKIILPPNSQLTLDCTTNKGLARSFFLAVGQQWFVKESGVPTMGAVYISVVYGQL